jgi:asparagine synthase (glutamine-hydrolysing)
VCGINGIVTKAGVRSEIALRDDVLAMNRAILHRGPDGTGSFAEHCAALGHVRLAILDLSADGAQPMHLESSSLVLVFNGEIYNYIELRDELSAKGRIFHTRCDTEVILHAFEEWGEECVKRFNGMWAFAIWDRITQRLFISRDRLGVKPLYFKAERDSFIFSSELKGITAVRSLTQANRGKVHDYLAYGYRVNDGQTFFAEVNELPPAHNLTLENGIWTISRYWCLPARETHQQLSNNQGEERRHALRELLGNAVRLRFRSDVPVALMQSGGLDSSIIACIVNDLLAKGDLETGQVLALTAHFPGSEYDEVDAVKRLLSPLAHIDLKTVELSGSHLAEHLHEFIREIGEPVASPTSFAHWSLMKELKKQGIKCVINGQGADEAFAGYVRYIIGYRLLDLFFSRPWSLPRQIISLMRRNRFSLSYILAQFFKALAGRRAAAHVRSRVERVNDVLNPEFRKEHDSRLPDLPMSIGPDNLDQHLRRQLEYYGFNQILHYEDHSSMSQGIEIRSPFVDYRMMEFAFSLPDTDRFDHGRTKAMMRDAYKGLVPDFIVESTVKIGFQTPSDAWLTSPGMKSIFDEFCHGSLQCRTIWDETKMKKRFADQKPGNFPLWRFLNVELWAREYGITNL